MYTNLFYRVSARLKDALGDVLAKINTERTKLLAARLYGDADTDREVAAWWLDTRKAR